MDHRRLKRTEQGVIFLLCFACLVGELFAKRCRQTDNGAAFILSLNVARFQRMAVAVQFMGSMVWW